MRPVFIGGCDRSGTTLLATELARLDGVIALPESPFIRSAALKMHRGAWTPQEAACEIAAHFRFRAWREAGAPEPATVMLAEASPAARLDRLIGAYAEKTGEDPAGVDVFIEHSPDNRALSSRCADIWPDMKFIHVVRDGRAVAASLIPLDWGPNTIVDMARFWRNCVLKSQETVEAFGPARALTVKYENLVAAPESVMEEVHAFLRLSGRKRRPGGPAFRRPGYAKDTHRLVGGALDPSRAQGWRTKLSMRDIELFEFIAGETLDLFGYEPMCDKSALTPPNIMENLRMKAAKLYRGRLNHWRYRRRHEHKQSGS